MSTLVAKADALRADFALPNDAAFPEIVNVVSRQLGKEPPPGTLAEQLDQLYREVHGESGSSSATTGNVANASAAEEPPVVMGVPIGIGTSGTGTAGASASTSGAPQSIKTVADAIQEAIAIGAPTYNNGDHFGCYFIYKRVAEEICARLPSAEPTRRALELAVDQAEAQANGGSARRGAWTMRYTFDDLRATPATPVLEGMPTAARLFAEYTPPPAVADARASRAARSACPRSSTAPATTVKGALAAAIEVGAPPYNRGNHAGCFYIYYRTAMEIIERCGDAADARAHVAALSAAVARVRGMGDNPDGAAWVLRSAFDRILERRGADPPVEGMPSAKAIAAEANFPKQGGAGRRPGGCVIA